MSFAEIMKAAAEKAGRQDIVAAADAAAAAAAAEAAKVPAPLVQVVGSAPEPTKKYTKDNRTLLCSIVRGYYMRKFPRKGRSYHQDWYDILPKVGQLGVPINLNYIGQWSGWLGNDNCIVSVDAEMVLEVPISSAAPFMELVEKIWDTPAEALVMAPPLGIKTLTAMEMAMAILRGERPQVETNSTQELLRSRVRWGGGLTGEAAARSRFSFAGDDDCAQLYSYVWSLEVRSWELNFGGVAFKYEGTADTRPGRVGQEYNLPENPSPENMEALNKLERLPEEEIRWSLGGNRDRDEKNKLEIFQKYLESLVQALSAV